MHGVILLAAGSGKRMGSEIADKVLEKIGESTPFQMSIQAFANSKEISKFTIVFRDFQQKKKLHKEVDSISELLSGREVIFCQGGNRRCDSVWNGLMSLPDSCEFAHIHDCDRPLIRSSPIQSLVTAVEEMKPVALARPVTNTIRKDLSGFNNNDQIRETETLCREELWEMETPQSSPKSWLVEGYQKAKNLNIEITDDMHALELVSKKILLMDPGYPNPKITHKQDLSIIQLLSEL